MKKVLITILFMLAAIGAYGQNKFKYPVNANGGLRVGGDDHSLIDSVKLVTGDVVIYIGGVAYTASGATIVDVRGEIEDSLNVLRPLIVMVADTGTMLIPYINRADTSGMLVNYILTSEANAAYANKALSNLASVAINSNLLPNAAGTIDLGSATYPFDDVDLDSASVIRFNNAETITHSDGTLTVGADLALGSNNLTITGSISTASTIAASGLVSTGAIRVGTSEVGSNVDSLKISGTTYQLYDGATQLAPDIPAAGEAELGTYAYLLGDTLYSQNPAVYTQRQVDSIATLKANVASPTFTGTPAAPTAGVGTNTTQIATTEFVMANSTKDEWDVYFDSLNLDIVAQALGVPLAAADETANDLADGTATYQPVYIKEACIITGIRFISQSNGNYQQDNNNHVALYTFRNDSIIQVAISANDSTKWETSIGTNIDWPLSSPYTANPGLYYVGWLYNAKSATEIPELASNTSVKPFRHVIYQTGQTALTTGKKVSTSLTSGLYTYFLLYYTP